MPNEEVPDDADVVISVQELDQLFHETFTNADIDVDSPAYRDAYISGMEDGSREMHRKVIENADIVIE